MVSRAEVRKNVFKEVTDWLEMTEGGWIEAKSVMSKTSPVHSRVSKDRPLLTLNTLPTSNGRQRLFGRVAVVLQFGQGVNMLGWADDVAHEEDHKDCGGANEPDEEAATGTGQPLAQTPEKGETGGRLLDEQLLAPGHLDVLSLHPTDMLQQKGGNVERHTPGHGCPNSVRAEKRSQLTVLTTSNRRNFSLARPTSACWSASPSRWSQSSEAPRSCSATPRASHQRTCWTDCC